MKKLVVLIFGMLAFGAQPALADAFSDQYTGMVGRIPLLTSPYRATDYLSAVRNGIPYKVPVFDQGTSIPPNPTDPQFGAKCDIQVFAGSASWSAGGTAFTPGNSITPTSADVGKKLVVLGAGTGGNSYAGTITGISGTAWTVTPALTYASGLTQPYGVVVATPQSGGGSYAPGDTITLTGGTITGGAQPILTVKYTKVESATIAAAGAGGVDGTRIVTGTTGRGQYFQANVTVAGGIITAVNSIVADASGKTGGQYFTNPTSLTNEPVTGAGLTGAQLSLKMGVAQAIPTSPGGWSVAPSNPVAQGSTSGSGTGATFTVTQSSVAVNLKPGWWYFGTDDATALQAGFDWAGTNQATLQILPKQWCGTSATLTMTDNFATVAGNGSGITEANRNFANMPYNSGLFWLGNGTDPMIEIATPDGASRILGNSVQRMALICGNRAGYALKFKTAYTGQFPDIYTQQCTNAAIETNTNTNAIIPTDTQNIVFSDGYINQEASNGVGIRLTGDPSVGTGDSSFLLFTNVHGWTGNDTWAELVYSDTNTFYNSGPYHSSFSGALYDWDLSGIPTFYTYSNHFIQSVGIMIVRGQDSSGTAQASIFNTYSITGDPAPAPVEGLSAQIVWNDPRQENSKTLTGKLITGLPAGGGQLFAIRNIIDNSTSGLYEAGDMTIGGGVPAALYFNLKFDSNLGFVHTSTGSSFALRNDNSAILDLLGAPTGAGGTAAVLTGIWRATAGGGVQIGSPSGGDKGADSLNVKGAIWSDGTQGIAACTVVTAAATITIKNGLITAFTGC